MPTPLQHDLGIMVGESDMSEAKKTLAMTYVREIGRISNGERNSVGAISDVLCAQAPMILELYKEQTVTREVLDKALQDHTAACPLQQPSKGKTIKLTSSHPVAAALAAVGWPGAILGSAYALYLLVKEVVKVFG